MEKAVQRGLSRKVRRISDYLGIDEKSFATRHRYETVVCDLTRGTVEAVLEDRRQDSLVDSYNQFSQEELHRIKAIAMDKWDPSLAATKARVPDAQEKIVFDRFHAIRQVTEAVDQVRRNEHTLLMAQGEEFLKGTKHLWLSKPRPLPHSNPFSLRRS